MLSPACMQGYNNGEVISREFFDEQISGGHNSVLTKFLWPDRDQKFRDDFADEKEALFRKYAGAHAPADFPHACILHACTSGSKVARHRQVVAEGITPPRACADSSCDAMQWSLSLQCRCIRSCLQATALCFFKTLPLQRGF